MKLVIGGAFQGKLLYAKEQFQMEDGWADGGICSEEELYRCCGVFHFHEYIGRMVAEGQDTSDLATAMIEKNPECVVVTNELGYGVVPVEAFDRQYRETTGRVCTKLAAYAECVHRVVCGIGQVIKGA